VLNMSRRLGSAVGVAVLVVLLASPYPGLLSLFRRGWLLEMVAAVGAGLIPVAVRRGPGWAGIVLRNGRALLSVPPGSIMPASEIITIPLSSGG
jgi:hypothetical protein